MYRVSIAIFAVIAAAAIAVPARKDARAGHGPSDRSAAVVPAVPATPVDPVDPGEPDSPRPLLRSPRPSAPVLALLVDTHSDERVPLYDTSPSDATFAVLLADRVSDEAIAIDPRLPALLRALAHEYPSSRIEIVSGYRSARLNEAMRQSGRHVAMHSQHSLGNAVDFRIVPAGETHAIDPKVLEQNIRALGWQGGTGCYSQTSDWFVHADVGPYRAWNGE
jgi:uncharacterized protein YcbK (DUF882 family)